MLFWIFEVFKEYCSDGWNLSKEAKGIGMVLFFVSILLSVLLTTSLAVSRGLYNVWVVGGWSVLRNHSWLGHPGLRSGSFVIWICSQTLGLETNQVRCHLSNAHWIWLVAQLLKILGQEMVFTFLLCMITTTWDSFHQSLPKVAASRWKTTNS